MNSPLTVVSKNEQTPMEKLVLYRIPVGYHQLHQLSPTKEAENLLDFHLNEKDNLLRAPEGSKMKPIRIDMNSNF